MKRTWHLMCLGVVGAALAAAALTAQEPTFPARATGVSSLVLQQLFSDYWRWHLAEQPEDATRVGVHDFDDRWHDWSTAGRAAARERRQEFLRNFQYAGLGNLTNRERLSLTLIEQRLASELASENLRLLSRLSPGGLHQEVFAVVRAMPVGSASDYERLLARLRALPDYVEQHIELWNEQLAAGLAQPASVVDRVAADVDTQRAMPAGRSMLLAAFRDYPPTISPAERERLDRAARTAYSEQFVPAWARLGRFLRDVYRPRARANLGITGLPSGSRQYLALLEYYGARADAVDTWHDQAIADVARVEPPAPSATSAVPAGLQPSGATFPEFRRHLRLPAFDEGWGVYKEGRMLEAAARAALDSGIHLRGWSRAQSVAFVTTHFGAGGADDLVDLVSASPGRALAVYAGARTFARLRQAAATRLRERFDEQEFDRTVLGNGVLSLDLVEAQVEESLKAAGVTSAPRP
jgi:uncharacterized protein (DUF885 family)